MLSLYRKKLLLHTLIFDVEKNMKRIHTHIETIFAVFGFAAACFIVWFTLALTWAMPLHIYQQHIFQRQFSVAVQPFHPSDSELLIKASEFGNFGNSNHCDYFAGEFRSSVFSKEEITNAYTDAPLLSFDGSNHLPVDVLFTDEESSFHSWPWSEWLERYLPSRRAIPGENIYLVSAVSAMHPPSGDIRCH